MGNTQGKRNSQDIPSSRREALPSPTSPGSPLTFTPQTQMEPLMQASVSDGFALSAGRHSPHEYHSLAGWPAQPKLVPTVITWSGGGDVVELEGSFDNWQSRQRMQRSGKDFTLVKLLPPGVYQYKYIVNGGWRYDPALSAIYDEDNNVNNILEVQEYVPENLESLTGFDPPPSPPESYNNHLPLPEDFAKEPPVMPPHLQLTLLNVPPAMDATATLPRPQHVILNHLYCQRTSHSVNAMVVGTTHRYKSKYITSVMYKPLKKQH